jgi:isocitrate dehydrogenase (NAD+)
LRVSGNILDAEESLKVTATAPLLELMLELEQGGVLKEEDGEGRKSRIAHRVLDTRRVAFVRESLKGASQQSDDGLKSEMNRLTHGTSLPEGRRQAKPLWAWNLRNLVIHKLPLYLYFSSDRESLQLASANGKALISLVSFKTSERRILMTHKITLIPGDGIGPEVVGATVSVIRAAGVKIEWESFVVGAEAMSRYGDPLPNDLIESIKRNKTALKGPVITPVGTGFVSSNVRLRKALDLYANLRPIKSLKGVKSRYEDVDLIVVRENTEDLYSGLEHEVVPGVVESLKIITDRASRRIAHFAFDYARREGRKKVTAIHKANIMKMSDGLFLNCFREVAKQYPEIVADDLIVDNACMQLVIDPNQFDVLLLENLYGDIISDLGAGLVGGLGVVPGANIGEEIAVFEAVHGSAPNIAGRGIANPTALIQTAVLMLKHLNEREAAERIQASLERVLAEGQVLTRDLGGQATTIDFTEAIIRSL